MNLISSKERVLNAVNHLSTDGVPITFDAEKEVYQLLYKHFGTATKEELFNALNVDTWMLLPGNFIYPESEDEKIVKTSVWGYKTKLVEYPGGRYDELFFSPLEGKDELTDIDELYLPEDDLLDFSHFVHEAEKHKDRAIIGAFTWGAYFLATHIRGFENLMLDFGMRQKYAEKLFERIGERCIHFIRRLLEENGDGIDIIYMADDYCSQQGPFFGPDDFDRYVVPYLKQVVDITHQHDKKFLLHVCGAVTPLLPKIIDIGVDMLEPIQVSANGMEPEKLKKEFGADLCFYGGMDIQEVLNRGTAEEVADETKRLIDILGKDGGYIFGPGHTYIQPDAPIENIITMYDTAVNYR